jgi:acetylglutamate kinase
VRAIGLSGSDDGLLRATLRDPALGLVGDVTSVNDAPLRMALQHGYVAVIAPVAVDQAGGFLNINADTVAAHIAVALDADRLIYLTDVDGVSDASGPRRRLAAVEARQLIEDGVISGGMIPKIDACLLALANVGEAHIVDGRRPHVLLDVLSEREDIGTAVTAVSERE